MVRRDWGGGEGSAVRAPLQVQIRGRGRPQALLGGWGQGSGSGSGSDLKSSSAAAHASKRLGISSPYDEGRAGGGARGGSWAEARRCDASVSPSGSSRERTW